MQIISDIHLEYNPNFYPTKKGKYLALLGDIGYANTPLYVEFIRRVSLDYEKVFVIPGNHEYYGSTYEKTNEILKKIILENVYVLNNDFYILNGIRIVGSTLWSKIPNHLGFSMMANVNDYRKIKGNVSFHDTNRWHDESVKYITEQIEEAKKYNQKVIVLTHHSPKEEKGKSKHAFGTDLSYLINDPIILWAYGHTHEEVRTTINGVKIVSNPLGYEGEMIERHCEIEKFNLYIENI